MNWQNIVTPINVNMFEKYLRLSNYHPIKTEKLIKGFTEGFSIGYAGPENRQDGAHNLPLRVGDELELWNKVMKEVKEHRYSGPFKSPQ